MTTDRYKPLFDRDFMRAELGYDYADYVARGEDEALLTRLRAWAARELKRETQAEASFVQRFFVETWGYSDDGVGADHFQLYPKFPIVGAGQTGNRGEADLAIGHFTGPTKQVPQVVCEFKGIKADLDAPQNRKGNIRSPVMQARDYLWNARRGLFGNEAVQPRFAIVTDMDEFRLYWWDRFPDRYLRFAISKTDLFVQKTLLDDGEEARFDRFLFWFLFRPELLLSPAGRPRLERLIEKQGKESKRLEGDFYNDYRTYREVLINNINVQRERLGLTRGGAVRLAQKLLDRLIFVMFAEDMGARVGFPVNELKEQLERFSGDKLLRPEGREVWDRLKLIFEIMNEGGDLGAARIHNFNGGLFADDPAIDALDLPNRLFVRFGQARLPEQHKDTLLYLAATYNFASEGDARNSIGLYTLGHIFEQSIVELEKLEADAEGRASLTDVTKRKRDGVYYTPEWVVTRIVEETIDPLFARWRVDAGWPEAGEPSAAAAGAYWQRLQRIKVIDPACGSGAFLIVALRHLRQEFEAAADAAKRVGAIERRPEASAITRQILADNGWYLLGVLNSPVSNYIFKWLGKPKDNGYFEANKQFIAPLPIPKADRKAVASLSAVAKGLQDKHSERVELRAALDERLGTAARVHWPLEAILPDVRGIAQIEEAIPRSVPAAERKAWIDEQRAADEESALARIDGAIRLDTRFTVELSRGKLSFLGDDQVLARAFVGEAEAPLAEAQWRAAAIAFQPSGRNDAKRLTDRLRKVVVAAPPAVAEQIVELGGDLARLSADIDVEERQLHEMTAVLFNLSPEEEAMVLRGRV